MNGNGSLSFGITLALTSSRSGEGMWTSGGPNGFLVDVASARDGAEAGVIEGEETGRVCDDVGSGNFERVLTGTGGGMRGTAGPK